MQDGHLLRKTLAPHWWDMSPEEAKIFITLFWFADPSSHELRLSPFSLSQKANLKTKELLPYLHKLKSRGLIEVTPGANPFLESKFKILSGKDITTEQLTTENSQELQYLPVDSDDDFSPVTDTVNGDTEPVSENGLKNKPVTGTGKRSERFLKNTVTTGNGTGPKSIYESEEGVIEQSDKLTAKEIAKRFDDLDNLALYEAYLQRYPHHTISKAYEEVLRTPPEKIKKSFGAYFTFLVKKYGRSNS